MKRWMLFCVLFFLPISAHAEPIEISAKSAIVLEYGTGQVLYAKDADRRLPMASTTKIMTALLALEQGELTDRVQISTKAAHTEGSSMYLKPGQSLSLETLLYGLMLSSGNDAAVAIAEHISGSEAAFAEAMTKTKGRALPFGFLKWLKALRKPKAIELGIISVKKEYQKLGVTAFIIKKLFDRVCQNPNIEYAVTGVQLETNTGAITSLEMFERELIRRKTCYIKKLTKEKDAK